MAKVFWFDLDDGLIHVQNHARENIHSRKTVTKYSSDPTGISRSIAEKTNKVVR